jgi:hypothetical protein
MCSECTKYYKGIAMAKDKDAILKLRTQASQHNALQQGERRAYYLRKIRAMSSPAEFLSIILDAMDQAKCSLPHFVKPAKDQEMEPLVVSLMGAKVHGRAFPCFLGFPLLYSTHGPSFTMETLWLTLRAMPELPKTLYMQLDNAASTNKNKYLFAFFAYLVQEQIFDHVVVRIKFA